MTAAIAFTKDELRKLAGFLGPLPFGGRALTAEEAVDVECLVAKTKAMMSAAVARDERGRKVLEWRLPTEQAPTMNEWGSWRHWRRGRVRDELVDAMAKMIVTTPGLDLCGAERRRWVRVTRFTMQPKNVDDAAADVIGGKMPIDVLVRMGVLAGDSPRFVHREAMTRKTTRGNTHVLVEVFECAEEEIPDDGPKDAPVVQIKRKRGPFTRAIVEGGG